jgi:hypothetical protein
VVHQQLILSCHRLLWLADVSERSAVETARLACSMRQ